MVPIFLINLDRDKDRLEHMRLQFDAMGQTFQRIPGVLGRQLPQHLRDQFPPSDLVEGLVGSYASHLITAQALLDSKSNAGIVLEDDVDIDVDNFVPVTASALAHAPPGWDLVNVLSTSSSAMLKVCDLVNGRTLVRFSRYPWDCAGYMLSRSGAAKILKWKSRTKGIDFEMRHPWQFGFNSFGIAPPPVRGMVPFESSVDALSSTGRPIPRTQMSIDGLLWYWRTLGLIGAAKCATNNAITGIKRHLGQPKGPGAIVS